MTAKAHLGGRWDPGEQPLGSERQRVRSAPPGFNRRAEASQLAVPASRTQRRLSAGKWPVGADRLPQLLRGLARQPAGAAESEPHLTQPGLRLDGAARPRCIARRDWQLGAARAPALALYAEPPAGPLTMGGASALVLGRC